MSGVGCSTAVSDSCCGACSMEEAEFVDRGELMELTAAVHTDSEVRSPPTADSSLGRAGSQESVEETPHRQRGVRSSSGSKGRTRDRLMRSKRRSIAQQLLELDLVEGRRDHEDFSSPEPEPGGADLGATADAQEGGGSASSVGGAAVTGAVGTVMAAAPESGMQSAAAASPPGRAAATAAGASGLVASGAGSDGAGSRRPRVRGKSRLVSNARKRARTPD